MDDQQVLEKMLYITNPYGLPVKTIMRYHFMPVRMTNIRKQDITIAGENVKNREPLCKWWDGS